MNRLQPVTIHSNRLANTNGLPQPAFSLLGSAVRTTDTVQFSARHKSKSIIPTLKLNTFINGTPQEKQAFAMRLGKAMSEVGFVSLDTHGVSNALLKSVFNDSKRLFALSEQEKMRAFRPECLQSVGYYPCDSGVEKPSLDGSKTYYDQSESWQVSRTKKNLFPFETPNAIQTHFESLYDELDTLSVVMAKALDLYLKNTYQGDDALAQAYPENYIESLLVDDDQPQGNHILRALHYPAILTAMPGYKIQRLKQKMSQWISRVKPFSPESNKGLGTSFVRIGGHNDFNLFTFLPEATERGLQIQTRDGKWVSVKGQKGQILMNAGDMLSFITGGQLNEKGQIDTDNAGDLPATRHRVLANESQAKKNRISLPYFVTPAPGKLLTNFKTGDSVDVNDFTFRRLARNLALPEGFDYSEYVNMLENLYESGCVSNQANESN